MSDGNGTREGVWLFDSYKIKTPASTLTSRPVELVSRCVDTGYNVSNGHTRRMKPWAVSDMMSEGGKSVDLYVMFSISNDHLVRGLRFARVVLSRETFNL